MKAQELRSDNLIFGQYENEDNDLKQSTICRFIGYEPFNKQIWVENDEQIEEFCEFLPIPITEEWLLMFGFKKEIQGYTLRDLMVFEESDYLRTIDFENFEFGYYGRKQIKFVHQLQNLYFALTNKELTNNEK